LPERRVDARFREGGRGVAARPQPPPRTGGAWLILGLQPWGLATPILRRCLGAGSGLKAFEAARRRSAPGVSGPRFVAGLMMLLFAGGGGTRRPITARPAATATGSGPPANGRAEAACSACGPKRRAARGTQVPAPRAAAASQRGSGVLRRRAAGEVAARGTTTPEREARAAGACSSVGCPSCGLNCFAALAGDAAAAAPTRKVAYRSTRPQGAPAPPPRRARRRLRLHRTRIATAGKSGLAGRC